MTAFPKVYWKSPKKAQYHNRVKRATLISNTFRKIYSIPSAFLVKVLRKKRAETPLSEKSILFNSLSRGWVIVAI